MKLSSIEIKDDHIFENLQLQFPADADNIVFIGSNGSGKTRLIQHIGLTLYLLFKIRQKDILLKLFQFVGNKIILNNVTIELFDESVKRTNFKNQKKHLVILSYSAKSIIPSNFTDSNLYALTIPVPTNFDMVYDWFVGLEGTESRRRLRVNDSFRHPELECIRAVVFQGMCSLTDGEPVFTDLQTEYNDNVTDGLVTTWLSIKKNERQINVNQLSGGEIRVLVLFIDIARRLITAAKENDNTDYLLGEGIVLIDEIELHLHPNWQRNLLPTLNMLFPNVQFIVTTHSPQVLSSVPNGCVFSLDNGEVFEVNTYGKTTDYILQTVFGDVGRPREIQQKLEAYFEFIKTNQTEAASNARQELESLIGTDDPDLIKADILIRRKTLC